MKIAVGISGGVDSAVAAVLCKESGHDVIGVTMKIWDESLPQQGIDPAKHACYGPEEEHDIEDAKKICELIGIPLHVIDCTEEFNQKILSYFRNTYLQGKTPNPCVYCNQQLKFGLLPQLLQKQVSSFDFFATGHYARIRTDDNGEVHLLKAADRAKDQSYFLYRLTKEQLKRSLLPLGDLTKSEVRQIAKQAHLHVWDKDESQDFYSGDYRDLINQGNNLSHGKIVDSNGTLLGTHDGIWNFTIGQRKGLGITAGKPLYVVGINAEQNTVVVGEKDLLMQQNVILTNFNQLETLPEKAQCKVRSSAQLQECQIKIVNDSTIRLSFDIPVSGICPGQSAVLYEEEVVIGGGVITKC